jgi:hypothetical protein
VLRNLDLGAYLQFPLPNPMGRPPSYSPSCSHRRGGTAGSCSFILLEPVELVLRRLTFMPSTSTTAKEPYQAEKVFCMEVNEELQQ